MAESDIFESVKDNRSHLVFLARIAEQAERYEDMVQAMKSLATLDKNLSVEERNLLSVAYKNVVGARRASWRILDSIERKEDDKDFDAELSAKRGDSIKSYRTIVEEELRKICAELQDLITEELLPATQKSEEPDAESEVFYRKMAGDYYRYRAEFEKGDKREEAAASALAQYEAAEAVASNLPNTSPIRLGLALNFSVFYYEILSEPTKACELAKDAFDCAIADLDELEEQNYKDATLIMQLLRDNLALWTQGDGDNEDM